MDVLGIAGGLAVILAVLAWVVRLYRRGNAVTPVRRPTVQAGDGCPCGGTIVPRTGEFGDFLGCTNYNQGHGCLRVWHVSGRRFLPWELHMRRAA
jgi:Ser-tRNA(Ala) deacylase AlaX